MHLEDDQRWKQWTTWFDTAYKDVLTLLHNRHVWRNLIAMLAANSDVKQHTMINGWLTRCYSQTQAVGIRRQSEFEGRRPTLGALLRELESPRNRFARPLPGRRAEERHAGSSFRLVDLRAQRRRSSR